MDTVERGAAAEDIQLLNRFPAQECTEQAAQPQDVVEMPMREEDAREILKARARLQDLTLCPFTTIDEKTVFIMFDDQSREAAFGGRRGGGSAKKKYFEQSESFSDRKSVTRHSCRLTWY